MFKIKRVLVICLFMLVALSATFAAGGFRLGLEFGNPAAVFILRLSPFDFKLGYNFEGLTSYNSTAFIHLSADYRIVEMNLIDFLNVYLGAGLYAQIETNGTEPFSFGGRLPVAGLNAYLLKNALEFFVEIVPTISFFPNVAFDSFQGWVGFTVRIPKF